MKILHITISLSLALVSFCFVFAFLLSFALFCKPHDTWGTDENCLTQHRYIGWTIVAVVIGLVALIVKSLKE